ncbi:unnamed protein product, partial [Ectocarpus sp. 4 AP-2014]
GPSPTTHLPFRHLHVHRAIRRINGQTQFHKARRVAYGMRRYFCGGMAALPSRHRGEAGGCCCR